MTAAHRFDAVATRYGLAELEAFARSEGLQRRGSGRARSECPGCRNGDPRGASLGEKNGRAVWHCFRNDGRRLHDEGTIVSFIALARGQPAAVVLDDLAGGTLRVEPRVPGVVAPQRAYPPRHEVAELWAAARPLSSVREVLGAWHMRAVKVDLVEERDLARALPFGVRVPRWAWGAGHAWSEGAHRLLVPMYDARGELVTLHARAARAPAGKPKGLSPAGCAVAGALMADAAAVAVLRGATAAPADFLVAEGVPDFLTWSTHWSDAAERAPAVFSVIAGSWTEALAARLPSGSRVLVATHHDDAGAKYALQIARTLAGRCTALRSRTSELPA